MSTRRRWSTTTRMAIWNRFDRKCQMCRKLTDERGFDLDHHIPLEIGGEDAEENLRPLCRPCHRLKTRSDVAVIAKAKRNFAKHHGGRAPSRLQSRGFDRAPPQHSATRPLDRSRP